MIAAPEGDYKVRPDRSGRDERRRRGRHRLSPPATAPSRKGNLNANAVPEAPVHAGRRPPRPAPQPRRRRAPPRPRARAAPGAAPRGAAAPTIQLGAFSSQAGANRAWTRACPAASAISRRSSHSVVPAQVGGRTLYRLRASGADAAGVCRRLQVAGEDCSVVG